MKSRQKFVFHTEYRNKYTTRCIFRIFCHITRILCVFQPLNARKRVKIRSPTILLEDTHVKKYSSILRWIKPWNNASIVRGRNISGANCHERIREELRRSDSRRRSYSQVGGNLEWTSMEAERHELAAFVKGTISILHTGNLAKARHPVRNVKKMPNGWRFVATWWRFTFARGQKAGSSSTHLRSSLFPFPCLCDKLLLKGELNSVCGCSRTSWKAL